MNKNTILGFVFIFLILIGYSWYMAPSEEVMKKQAAEARMNDSIQKVQIKEAVRADSIRKSQQAISKVQDSISAQTVVSDSSLNAQVLRKFGDFAGVSHGENKTYIIENEKIKLKINTKGGIISYAEIKNYRTYDTLPLVLFNSETAMMSFLLNDQQVETKDLYFEPVVKSGVALQDSVYLEGDAKYTFAMRIYPSDASGALDKSRFMEFEYTFKGNDYMVDYHLNMQGMSNVVAPGLNDIPLFWTMQMISKEKDPAQEMKQTAVYYRYLGEDVKNLTETNVDDADELETKVQWISFKQQFFSVALISKNSFAKAKIKQSGDELNLDPKFMKNLYAEISVPLASSSDFQSIPMQMYMGPNKYKVLKTYEFELERQIPLGWGFFLLHWINRFAVIPVFDFLSSFGWNYGIIILVLTILLKIFLFPIAYKTYMSSAKMRVLKPEVDEIGGKFPKKEDALKKQQATMALYKKAGVNPMAGCIPMLLQMPILFALFKFFPAAIELRQQGFLWADDLSTYDAIVSWSAQIPILSNVYGNHVSLFTVLMTISTIFYTKINNDMMSSSQQLPGMKTMMYLMPLMFLGFFNNYASGLSYYYFLANVITFAQMYAMRMFVNETAIHAKIQENKKKPVKKSKFQEKLEEMAKQKGLNQK